MPSKPSTTSRRWTDRIAALHWSVQALAGFGIGALMALGQAPRSSVPALLVGLGMVFALFLVIRTARRAAWIGWAIGAGYFGIALRWIYNPFMVDAERYAWMAPFAVAFLAGGLALFWALAFGVARWLSPKGVLRDVLVLALMLTVAEYLRGAVFTGFPWAGLAQGLIDTPAARALAWVGPHGVTLALLLVVGLFIWVADRITTLVYPAAVLGVVGIAYLAAQTGPPAPDYDGPVVRLIQPNAPQDEKWDPDKSLGFVQRMMEFTAAGETPDLAVWPETALPYLLEYAAPVLEQVSDLGRGAPVVLGIQRREDQRFFNSLIVLGRGGEVRTRYDKAHLVPFGEYVPFGELMAKVGIYGFAATQGAGFSAGQGGGLVDIPGIGTARALICYEGIFPEEMIVGARPRLLLLITNDAWFGQDAGPYQHLAQARMRAIEQGLPMVRVANTGVSAMIDGHGQITASLPLGEAGYLDVPLPPALEPTPYSRRGDWPVLVLLAIASGAAFFTRRRFAIDQTGKGA